jgi:plastocyanin
MGIFSRIAHTLAGGDFRMSIREPHEVMAEDAFIPALVEASNRSERVIVVEGTVKYQLLRSRRRKDSEGREGWDSIPSQTTEGMVVISPQPMTMQPGDTVTFIANIPTTLGGAITQLDDSQQEAIPDFMRKALEVVDKVDKATKGDIQYSLHITVFEQGVGKLETDSATILCVSGNRFSLGGFSIGS